MRISLVLFCLICAHVFGQTVNAINGQCSKGGQNALFFNTPTTGTQPIGGGSKTSGGGIEGSYPNCSVQIFLTGTVTPATLYADSSLHVLFNPFIANNDGSWVAFVQVGQGYDIFMSGGGLPATVPLVDVFPGTPMGSAGSGVVSTATKSQQAVYLGNGAVVSGQTKPFNDVRDFGVTGDGSTDDTSAMQAAINALCPGNVNTVGANLHCFNGAHIKISSTLLVQRCNGFTLDGQQSQGQTTMTANANCTLNWAGSAGGTVLEINQTRDSEFKNFAIDAGNANVGILVDEIGLVNNIVTNNHFSDLAIWNGPSANANWIGVSICPTAPGNCEAQNFDRILINCAGTQSPTSSNQGIGIKFGPGGEPFYEFIHWFEIATCSDAIYVSATDVLDIDGGLPENNYTDLFLAGGQVTSYKHTRSENAIAQIVYGTASSSMNDLLVESNHFGGLNANTTTISYSNPSQGGTVRLIRNTWDSLSTVIPFGPTASGAFNGEFVSENNIYPGTICPVLTSALYWQMNDCGAGFAFQTGGGEGLANLFQGQFISNNGGFRSVPKAFGSIFSCVSGQEGTTQTINDSTTATHGATISGGGSNHVVGYCNGTNWVVLYP